MKRSRRVLPPYVIEDVARATGQVRLYYRAPKPVDGPRPPKVRIWPSVEQEGFWPAYEAAKRGESLPKPVAPAQKRAGGIRTFETLCADYFLSGPFFQLTATGQRSRRATLKHCCDEETKPGSGLRIGDTPLAVFNGDHVKALRDRKAQLPEAANGRLKAISAVFSWHIEGKDGMRNPCTGIKRLKSANADGFHSWSLDEVAAYERHHPLGTTARLAFDLALYTSQRRSDVVRMGPEQVIVEDGIAWLAMSQRKTKTRVEIPIIEQLAESIAARPSPGPTFLKTSFSKPYTANGIGNAFRAWCDQAGLPQCAMHGLRKATASRLAELGCSEDEIASITGHTDSKSLKPYTRGARKRVLAGRAIAKLKASLTSVAVKVPS